MTMTNIQFAIWRAKHFPTVTACARAFGIDRDTVTALECGQTRKGTPYPVPNHIALACAAWTLGIRHYAGGPVEIGG